MKKILLLIIAAVLFSYSTAFAQPANDDCAGAVVLTPQAGDMGTCSGSATSYSTEFATASAPPSGDYFGKDDDVWFSFTTTATVGMAYSVTLSNKTTSSGPGGMSTIELWSEADCNNAAGTSIGFYSYATSANFGLLSPNTTYKIRVYSPGNTSANRLTGFNICVNTFTAPPPSNDTYYGAKTLSFNPGATCTNTLTGEVTMNATTEFPAACSGAGTNPPKDVWYKFTATNPSATIELKNITQLTGSSNTMWMQLLQSSNTGPSLICTNTNILSTETAGLALNPGTTYYLRVYNDDASSFCSFDICTKIPPGPTYVTCADAANLTPSLNASCSNGLSLTNASITGSAYSSCAGTNYNNVWIKFVAPANSTNYIYSVSNYVKLSGNTNPILYNTLYSGDCATPVQVSCLNNGYNLPSLTAGNTYYIKIGTYYDTDQGNFNVCIYKTPDAPANIDCNNAVTLTASTGLSGSYVSGTTYGLPTQSLLDCFGYNSPNKFVWYKFVATATSHFVEFNNIVRLSPNQNALGYKMYTGNCGTLTELSPTVCVPSVTYQNQELTGLTPTQTYYIQVMENTYNGGPVSFDIRVRGAGVANDEPATAIQLLQNPTCTNTSGTLKFSTLTSTPSAPPGPSTPTQDVWYKFTAATTSATVTLATNSVALRRVVYANNLTTVLYDDFNTANLTSLTVGANYYIRILSNDAPTLSNAVDFSICVSGVPSPTIANVPTPSGCATVDGPVTSTNSNIWLHLTHQGKLLASVLDAPGGSGMGVINAGYYINTSSVRSGTDGTEYLDRNFSINPTQQPINPVKVRLYFGKSEFDALVDANDGDGNDVYYLNDLKITKFSSVPCGTTISNNPSATINVDAYGSLTSSVYWVEFTVPSFSSFYIQNNQVVLPIACGGFNYKMDDEKVVLKWSTLSESNSSHFDIEKSTDDVNFEKIGTVKAAGNSITTLQYSFTDNHLPAKTTYYRLKQTDKNGYYKYICSVLKVIAKPKSSFGLLYPNPVKSMLMLDIEKPVAGKVNVQIINTIGQPVMQYQQSLSNSDTQLRISTAKLTQGSYVLKITSEKEMFTQTFVKD